MVHKESDHTRIARLTQTFQSRINKTSEIRNKYEKIYECSECGVIFATSELMETHNMKHHQMHKEEKKNKDELEHQELNEEEGH